MNYMQRLKNGFNKVVDAVQKTVAKGSTTLKSATENFFGEMILNAAFNRFKKGALGMLEDDFVNPSESRLTDNPIKEPRPQIFTNPLPNSHNLMASLLNTFTQPATDAANHLAHEVEATMAQVSSDIAHNFKRVLKEKVSSIQPEDVVNGIKKILDSLPQEFKNSAETNEDTKAHNTSFNLNGSLQILGWVIMALAIVLMVNGMTQEADQEARPTFEM